MVEDEASRVRRAVESCYAGLSFEYGDAARSLPSWDEVRRYRQHDNVERPVRRDGYRHGLVVHRLTTLIALQRVELRRALDRLERGDEDVALSGLRTAMRILEDTGS